MIIILRQFMSRLGCIPAVCVDWSRTAPYPGTVPNWPEDRPVRYMRPRGPTERPCPARIIGGEIKIEHHPGQAG